MGLVWHIFWNETKQFGPSNFAKSNVYIHNDTINVAVNKSTPITEVPHPPLHAHISFPVSKSSLTRSVATNSNARGNALCSAVLTLSLRVSSESRGNIGTLSWQMMAPPSTDSWNVNTFEIENIKYHHHDLEPLGCPVSFFFRWNSFPLVTCKLFDVISSLYWRRPHGFTIPRGHSGVQRS